MWRGAWPTGHVACGRFAQMRQDPSTVFVAETLPTKRPVRPPAVGAQQLEAGGRSGEPGVADSCINTVATSPPPAAAPMSSAASTVSKTQQHEYLGGQHRRLGGASRSCRGEAFRSGASCSMFVRSARRRAVLALHSGRRLHYHHPTPSHPASHVFPPFHSAEELGPAHLVGVRKLRLAQLSELKPSPRCSCDRG